MKKTFESDTVFAKRIVKEYTCTNHGEKVRLTFDYDRDENAIPHISKCCCKPFAQIVANALYDTGIFDIVYLEHKTGLTTLDIILEENSLT